MKTKLISCKACGNKIAKTAAKCPQCGNAKTSSAALVFLVVLAIFILMAFGGWKFFGEMFVNAVL